jgi:hypothetical protein
MKKVVFIAVCTVGILSLTSCKSSYSNCGLAKNMDTKGIQHSFQQTTNTIALAVVK